MIPIIHLLSKTTSRRWQTVSVDHVQIIPDQYPVIQLQQHENLVTKKQILLTGTAGDDYGITRVTLNYEVLKK